MCQAGGETETGTAVEHAATAVEDAATNPAHAEQPEGETLSVGSSEDADDEEGWEDMEASPAGAAVGAASDSPDAAMAEGDDPAMPEAAAVDEEDAEVAAEAQQVSLCLLFGTHACLGCMRFP